MTLLVCTKGRGVDSTARGVSFLDGVTDVQGEGVRFQLHLPPLPLPCNAIGSKKSIFPGVMVYSSVFYSHFTLKGFQKIIFFMGREGRFGIAFQLLNHSHTSDFRGQ